MQFLKISGLPSAAYEYLFLFRHIVLCNILTTMLRPNFEVPLDSAQDIVDNNKILYVLPNGETWKQFLEISPVPEYNKLAENMIITKERFKNKKQKKCEISHISFSNTNPTPRSISQSVCLQVL